LFRGSTSTLQAVGLSNFIYFYLFHGLKRFFSDEELQSAKRDLLFACTAGKFL